VVTWPVKPRFSYSTEPARILDRCDYGLSSPHCPFEPATLDGLESKLWRIDSLVDAGDMSRILRADRPWPEELYRCWSDQMALHNHPVYRHLRVLVRRINLGCLRADGEGFDWVAHIALWHPDAVWLAGLPYSQIGALLRPDLLLW
jgi:hypothetical protein